MVPNLPQLTLHKNRKSHQRQWVDAFKSFLPASTQSKIWGIPHTGSVGMVQVLSTGKHSVEALGIPHTAVWGWFKSFLPRSTHNFQTIPVPPRV